MSSDAQMSLEEVAFVLQRFSWPDYIVFVLMLTVCAVIGVYFGFIDKATSSEDYLIGGRKMTVIPISLSLIASYISGITLLGTPTEVYVYGIQYLYMIGGVFIMGVLMSRAYLPVYHDLRLTSSYEYLALRFDKRVRLLGSALFCISILIWLPLVIYVPALAFNQVSGINVHIVTPAVCVICIFYTCVGGIKAVVWTDAVQTFSMFGAMLLVIIKGTSDVGGFQEVIKRNIDSQRIEAIVESCGGVYLTTVPSKWPEQSVVISQTDDKAVWRKLKVKGITPPIVAAEMLLLGVLQHRLDIETHRIV